MRRIHPRRRRDVGHLSEDFHPGVIGEPVTCRNRMLVGKLLCCLRSGGGVMRHTVVGSSLLGLASVGVLAGCSSPRERMDGGLEPPTVIPVEINRDLDLLFVIDDSPSMADKQANLATNFPELIDVLGTVPGGLPNVHVAVVTSDLGTKDANGTIAPGIGTLGMGGCSGSGDAGNMQLFGAPVAAPSLFISDIQPPDPLAARIRNYTGNLSDVFAQMARGAGAGGCGFEQHLEAMKQALDPSNATNAGFLRSEAYLAVIFLADEDDCSMSDSTTLLGPTSTALGPLQSFRCTRFGVVCDDGGATPDAMNELGPKSKCHPSDTSPYLAQISAYAQFLKDLKTDPNSVIVAGIMGTTEPFAIENRSLPNSSTLLRALAHSCTYIGVDGKAEVADPAIRRSGDPAQVLPRSVPGPQHVRADLPAGTVRRTPAGRRSAEDRSRRRPVHQGPARRPLS
jgi:hypothetical protein